MKKLYLNAFALTLCGFFSQAQTVTPTVLASDGGYTGTAQGSIAWTIGEPVGDTYTSAPNITTMGFHQPEMDVATLIAEQGNTKGVLIYPNPVKENLQIDLSGLEKGNYQLELIDAIGKLIYKSDAKVTDNSTKFEMKMNEVAAAQYFLIIKSENFNKTIKINKVN